MTAYLVLSAVIFLTFLASGSTWPFLPLYSEQLGASLVQIAWIVGSYSTVSLLANLLWGRVSDRLGRRKPFLVGAMATLVVTSLAISSVSTWWLLLPLRLVEGLAFGAYAVASLAMMGDVLEGRPNRARLIGAYRMSGSLAFSIAIVAAGLIAQSFGFATTYKLAAGIFGLAFVISLALPEKPGAARSGQTSQRSFADLLRGPMLPLLVVAATFSVPFQAVFSVWPLWVAEELGLGRAIFAQLWGLAAFVEVPCMALAGYLTDRFGRRLTFLLGLTLFSCVYLLYFLAPTLAALVPADALPAFVPRAAGPSPAVLPFLVLAQLVRGFAFAAFTATALTMAIEVSPPEARGRAAGLYQIAHSLSQIAGNYAGGPLAQGFGFRPLFLLAAVTLLGGVAYVRSVVARPGEAGAAGAATG